MNLLAKTEERELINAIQFLHIHFRILADHVDRLFCAESFQVEYDRKSMAGIMLTVFLRLL